MIGCWLFKYFLHSKLLHTNSSQSNKASILKAKFDAMMIPMLAKVTFTQLSDQGSENSQILA